MKDANGVERDVTDGTSLRQLYRAAEPFEHIVLDDVLDDATLAAAMSEFPDLDAVQCRSSLSAPWSGSRPS